MANLHRQYVREQDERARYSNIPGQSPTVSESTGSSGGWQTDNDLRDHIASSSNPHGVTATQTSALVQVDGVGNPGGNVDFIAGNDMMITPSSSGNSITFDADVGSIEADELNTRFEPLTDGSTSDPQLLFTPEGDVLMAEVPN